MPVRLDKKRIFVTGGSRGLGRAFCRHFAELGADVAFCYSKDKKGADITLAGIEEHGVRGMALQGSVLVQEDIDRMLDAVRTEWGGLDILVNNAGVSQAVPLPLMEESDWDRVLDTNLKGIYLVTRTVLKDMVRNRNGVILNIGSMAGTRMIEAPVHYCAAKAAVKGMTEALSKEVGRYNIRVNCLAPGLLEEGVADNLPEEQLKAFLSQLSLGRVGSVDEIARMAGFMVSDLNSYMTGALVLVDGGF